MTPPSRASLATVNRGHVNMLEILEGDKFKRMNSWVVAWKIRILGDMEDEENLILNEFSSKIR